MDGYRKAILRLQTQDGFGYRQDHNEFTRGIYGCKYHGWESSYPIGTVGDSTD